MLELVRASLHTRIASMRERTKLHGLLKAVWLDSHSPAFNDLFSAAEQGGDIGVSWRISVRSHQRVRVQPPGREHPSHQQEAADKDPNYIQPQYSRKRSCSNIDPTGL